MPRRTTILMVLHIVVSILLLAGMLSLSDATTNETQEHFDNGCLVKVHKDNRLFGEDSIEIKRHCESK